MEVTDAIEIIGMTAKLEVNLDVETEVVDPDSPGYTKWSGVESLN